MQEKKYTIEEIKNLIKSIDYKNHENPEVLIVDIYCSLTPEAIEKANTPQDENKEK